MAVSADIGPGLPIMISLDMEQFEALFRFAGDHVGICTFLRGRIRHAEQKDCHVVPLCLAQPAAFPFIVGGFVTHSVHG